MDKQEAKGDLAALYFPFTYIQEEVLKTALFFFDKLVLYQPSEWQPTPLYPELVKAEALRLEVPITAGPELPALKQKVRHLLSWGDYVFSSGQLSYLKHLGQPEIPPEEYGEIMAMLRGEEPAKPDFDDPQLTQLFLHLAQERDQRDDEMSRLGHQLNIQESKLWSELLIDAEGLSQIPPAFIPESEDPISIANRLRAWSRLFEKGFSGAEIPLTDRQSVLELLPPHELLLNITLPDLRNQALPEILSLRASNPASQALAAVKACVKQLIQDLSSSPWKAEIIEDIQGAPLREALKDLEEARSHRGKRPPYRLSLCVFPNVPTTALFSKSTSNTQNGFAFLLMKGGTNEVI